VGVISLDLCGTGHSHFIMDRSYNGASAAYDKSIALKGKWGGDATDVELIRAVYEGLGYVDSPWHC